MLIKFSRFPPKDIKGLEAEPEAKGERKCGTEIIALVPFMSHPLLVSFVLRVTYFRDESSQAVSSGEMPHAHCFGKLV